MDETVLFPSPNWFQASAFAVSNDGWLVYGGPSKSLCILEPLSSEYNPVIRGQQGYTAHFVNRAHGERVVCVDISPEWPEKRSVISGSVDGTVKQWSLERSNKTMTIKSTHSHEIHSHEKEEVVGVGYCKDGYAVTVGSFGTIVKWDLNSNVAKSFNHVLKNFKPVCMACSPHIHMQVAIGTRQGVVFVLDLNGSPRIVYKVRGQDDEVLKVSWCPQYEVAVRKALKESDNKKSAVTEKLEKIRQQTESPETLRALDERVRNSQTSEQPVLINENYEPVASVSDERVKNSQSSEQPVLINENYEPVASVSDERVKNSQSSEQPVLINENYEPVASVSDSPKAELDESGVGKTLPEDSFDEVVQEDDTFDIYKEPDIEEFGHKKFQPVDILVKVQEEVPEIDYLAECQKLKDEILKRKNQPETLIGPLVEAMDKKNLVEEKKPEKIAVKPESSGKITKGEVESSVHIHKHLLATIGKQGSIRVWSKSGRLVGSCAVWSGAGGRGRRGAAGGAAAALLWFRPDALLIADGKSQLLDCNPLKVDCKNKLEWRVVHSLHKRGLFALASTAARVQTPDMAASRARGWRVWSAGQDRQLLAYDLHTQQASVYHGGGGFVYGVLPCPYDARKVALAVGDGAVRVWETDTIGEADTEGEDGEAALGVGSMSCVWQNVQGKVLTAAWHPTRDGLLAFATAESRLGLIDVHKPDKGARVLVSAVASGVYCLSWGERDQLYATGGGQAVVYDSSKPDQAPTPFPVSLEGVPWQLSVVRWHRRGLLAGSAAGAVSVLQGHPPHAVRAAAFPFTKMIHTIEWHPSEAAPHAELLAACSLDRTNVVAILQFTDKEDGSKQLVPWKTLSGHKGPVFQLAWSPHSDALLLSTSQDCTVRVWDVEAGECISIFGGHSFNSLSAAWALQPALRTRVLSGGGDCCLRLWDYTRHPARDYEETAHEVTAEKKKKKKEKKEKKAEAEEEVSEDVAIHSSAYDVKCSKRFLLPMIHKQTNPCSVQAPRKMLQKYLEKNSGDTIRTENGEEHGLDFIKIFGNINEVNEVLDAELERHEDMGNLDSWTILCIVRGYMDTCVQAAARRDRLDPFLLSVAPCVSFKYWKDSTMLYLQQIDRLVAKGEEAKLSESRTYGGPVFRRAASQLALHDVKAAVATLLEHKLYADAYVLSRTRYMDSLAEQALRAWAQAGAGGGHYNLAAVCYIALGELTAAAAALGRSGDPAALGLAADLALHTGQHTFAGHIEGKKELIRVKMEALQLEEREKDKLPELPSRVELLSLKTEEPVEESEDNDGKTVEESEDKTDDKDGKTEENPSEASFHSAIETESTNKVNTESDNKTETDESPYPIETSSPIKDVDTEYNSTEASSQSDIKSESPEKSLNSVEATSPSEDTKDDSTEKMLKELPEKMESLLKEVIENGVHKGDGDTINNVLTQELQDKKKDEVLG